MNKVTLSCVLLRSNQVSRDPEAELWLADIREAVRRANQQSQKALKCESGTLFCSDDLLITQTETYHSNHQCYQYHYQ